MTTAYGLPSSETDFNEGSISKVKNHWLLFVVGWGQIVITPVVAANAPSPQKHWLLLKNDKLTIGVDKDLSLKVYQGKGDPTWTSFAKPGVEVKLVLTGEKKSVTLDAAAERTVEDFHDRTHKGYRIRIRRLPGTDVELEIILALAKDGELLVQVAQVSGKDTVQRVASLYDFQIEPAPNSYVVVPQGSGYIIRSDSLKKVALKGFVGSAFTLPMFGIIRGDKTFYQIIETWWDTHLEFRHTPGRGTTISCDSMPSLGKLGYPRRSLLRFAEKLDHVGMAKAYRRYLIKHKKFTTLKQRATKTPALKHYLAGIEYRWFAWKSAECEQVLDNIRHFKKAGLPVTFFYPKFPEVPERKNKTKSLWQRFLRPEPFIGGWPVFKKLALDVQALGCPIVLMVHTSRYNKNEFAYDPAKASGVGFPDLSDRYALWALRLMLDSFKKNDFQVEALYFDCYSGWRGHLEHKDAKGRVSRRETYEAQIACFRETRNRGITPGAEVARFWSVGECDFFFFTDWSRDRLRNAEPIPLFQLVFHDCYGAHFSGGGYYGEGRYDWYVDRHPRLYELMYAAIPSYNWLPGGEQRSQLIKREDWGTEKMNRRIKWLKRWHAYYQKICYSEMLTHQFLNEDHTLQRVKFANGVVADFDLAKGLFRVKGVPGFTGDWEQPEQITR